MLLQKDAEHRRDQQSRQHGDRRPVDAAANAPRFVSGLQQSVVAQLLQMAPDQESCSPLDVLSRSPGRTAPVPFDASLASPAAAFALA